MRIGIDWGGTKLEVIALDNDGNVLLRERVATPQNDYQACVKVACGLVQLVEEKTSQTGTVGIGIPGTISPATGLVKNANSTWLNGQPLKQDLEAVLGREVRITNDANCFAVSEAVDGAGEGIHVVAGIIIGTGCGSGLAIDGQVLTGGQGIAGEFGHAPLAPMTEEEFPGLECWCGRRGCLETYVSGTGFERDYGLRIDKKHMLTAPEILGLNDAHSIATYEAYVSRLGRGLAMLTNIVDPDIIVLGGGMSNVEPLYDDLPEAIKPYVFTDVFSTEIVKAKHGDSSGVRGAAWLW